MPAPFQDLSPAVKYREAIKHKITPTEVQDHHDTHTMEKHFAMTHRDTPDGRNFATWNHPNFASGKRQIEKNFDKAFAGSPSSDGWLDSKFCGGCGKRHSMCGCS